MVFRKGVRRKDPQDLPDDAAGALAGGFSGFCLASRSRFSKAVIATAYLPATSSNVQSASIARVGDSNMSSFHGYRFS